MAQASKKRGYGGPLSGPIVRNIKEISFILLAAAALFLAIALGSYHPADPGWSQAVDTNGVHNRGGIVGAFLADLLLYLFGYFGLLFPVILAFDGWRIFESRRAEEPINHFQIGMRVLGFMLALAGGCGLAWMHISGGAWLPHENGGAGGIFGDGIGSLMVVTFGGLGGTLVMLCMFLVGITLYTGLSWLWVIDRTGYWTLELADHGQELYGRLREEAEGRRARRER
ncbi:MAG TPA: DNA translocase FtsK 4TM domain-containing protein, partial [Gammaproteobacteria bacterium]